MRRIAAANKARPSASNSASAERALQPLTESQAAEIMWVYYRDSKSLLVSDIKEHRAGILTKLMDGLAVEQVFAPFVKTAEPAKRLRRVS